MIVSANAARFVLRFPEELKEKLEKIAASEGRSLNSEVIRRLMNSLEGSGKSA